MAASAAQLSAAFDLPPQAAIDYLKSQRIEVAADWREAAERARAGAFTVARTIALKMVGDTRDAIVATLQKGLTGDAQVKAVERALAAKGWGSESLPSSARLATIVRTNTQRAYMQGRVADFNKATDLMPYWMYVAVLDGRTRPSHAALNGRVFRHDDPIWQHILPPCGYNCRCRIRALSERMLKRSGAKLESTSPGDYFTEQVRTGVDRETGEILYTPITGVRLSPRPVRVALRDSLPGALPQVERGQLLHFDPKHDPKWTDGEGPAWRVEVRQQAFRPDPGFGGSGPPKFDPIGTTPDRTPRDPRPAAPLLRPGASPVATAAPPERRMLDGQSTFADFGRPEARYAPEIDRIPAPALLSIAPSQSAAVQQLGRALGVSEAAPTRLIQTPVERALIDYRRLEHMVEERQNSRERYANFVLETFLDPWEVYLTAYDDGGMRTRYIGLFQGRRQLVVVGRVNADGTVFWNMLNGDLKRLDQLRVGNLLYSRKAK